MLCRSLLKWFTPLARICFSASFTYAKNNKRYLTLFNKREWTRAKMCGNYHDECVSV